MRPPKTIWITVLLAAAGLLTLFWWKSDSSLLSAVPPQEHGKRQVARHTVLPAANPLDSALRRLQGKPGCSRALQTLKKLQAALQTMRSDEAHAWIRSFPEGGQDQPTKLSFEIAAGGTLTECPTLRNFLPNTLLAVDPAAAALLSRQILATPTSADEWALALSNVGKAESSAESNGLLRVKTEELIVNPEWQAQPSIGYLHSFDVPVHTNATASTLLLSSLIQRKDRRDLAHAGFLTLDRLVQRNPANVLARLATSDYAFLTDKRTIQ